ncbi:hypothetical protein ABKA04_002789 [Annulohypoxylon sp. FPYF3050]
MSDLPNEYIDRSDPLNRRPRPEPVTKPQLPDRAAREKVAKDTVTQLTIHVNAIREDGLSDYEAKGFVSLPMYFLSEYQALIDLERQTVEILANQDDLVFAEDTFNKILDGFDEYQKWMSTNIHLFKNQPTVHSGLLRIVGNLAREPWIGYYQERGFRKHILEMSENIAQINPLTDTVWNGGDLIRRPEFGQVFDQFNQLSTRQLRDDADIRSIIFHSQRLLKEAFLGINLPNAIYALPNIYSGEDQRPTYIDYRWDSDQYRFGEGTRPGILKLKSQLGGTLTAEETEGIKKARGKSTKRPPPDDDDPSGNADQQRPTKIPRLVLAGGYSMNLRNVDADLGNIYEEGSLSVVKADSYNRFDIVTRTLPNKRSTLDRIRRREQNITNWERLLRRIREGTPGRETNGDGDTPKDKSPKDKSPTEKSLTSSPEGTEDPANVGDNSSNNNENNIDDLFDDPEDSWGYVTHQNSLNLPEGKIYQMQPIHPSTGVHFNEREERDHLALRRASALDSLYAQRFSGPRCTELRESLARYRDFENVLLDSFEEGGPPGHWGIPRETVFEQLAYMVVMTQWRTYMAKNLIKQGLAYPFE